MKTIMAVVAAMLLATAAAHAQQPQISFQVVEMNPASPATLHKSDRLYIRIRYDTNVPMWVRADYSNHGTRASRTRTSGAGLVGPGQGEMLVWASLDGEAAVDAISLSASASGRDGFDKKTLAVNYSWDGQPSTGEVRAPWVGPLLAEDEARQKAAFAEMEQRFYNTGSGGIGAVAPGGVVILLVLAAAAAGFVWPIWGTIRWTGRWRVAAMVPLAAVGLWALKDAFDLVRDPASHNLLPFEFGIAGLLAAPYMLVVAIWRRIRRRAALSGPPKRG
jgi:hypothetical protein